MKRLIDFCLSIGGLVCLSPLFLLIAFAIKLGDGGPVFYRQVRVGRNSRPFKIWKFRTMVVQADRSGGRLTIGRDPRITRVGGWLRRIKLDESPQLLNVLMGDMSLVGPRPEVPEYVDLYSESQREVLRFRPGVTDLASLHYYNEDDILGSVDSPEKYYREIVIPDKIRINLEYASRSSVASDFGVIAKTLLKCVGKSVGTGL